MAKTKKTKKSKDALERAIEALRDAQMVITKCSWCDRVIRAIERGKDNVEDDRDACRAHVAECIENPIHSMKQVVMDLTRENAILRHKLQTKGALK